MKKIILTAAIVGTMLSSFPVSAADLTQEPVNQVFDMSTDYPGIFAKAGDTTTFSLDFLNTTDDSLDADLKIAEIPENWTGFFKGKSGEISKVHVASDYEAAEDLATFSLSVPADAAEGVYNVKLTADADNGQSDDVNLEIHVSEVENGASTFTAEYPHQEAASGTKFTFNTTLVNNKGTDQSYSLTAQAAEGWQVTFTPSGETASVASLNLEAGASKEITVAITPPETLTEGEYTIPISAISSGENISTELDITITGQYGVGISTPDGRLSFDAYSNEQKAVTLSVTNTGNVELNNLNLTSAAPTDWEVTFDESTIDTLEPGATKEITAYVKPASDSMTGDYVTDITIKNDIVSAMSEFRVSVKTRTTWGLAAAGVIVVLLAILGVIFKKYGRR